MSRYFRWVAAGILVLSVPKLCGAQLKPDAIQRGKSATVLVRVSHDRGFTFGTGFCVDKAGLFITTAGVVEKAAAIGSAVAVIIDGGLKTERARRARVLRQDEDANLALLDIGRQPGLVALDLGQDASLNDLDEFWLLGFPLGNAFGSLLPAAPRTYPNVNILPSRIAALHRTGGQLTSFDLDIPITPGNSGGPVLDGAGRVVGVAVASAAIGVNKPVIPVARVSEFLTAPGLAFDPPQVTYKDRHQPVAWTVKVEPPKPGAPLPTALSVALTISYPLGDPRTFTAQPKGPPGTFEATVVPVPAVVPRKVSLSVWDAGRFRFEVIVEDAEVGVGAQKFRFSELRSLAPGHSPSVQTATGKVVNGPLSGLGKVTAKIDGKMQSVDLNTMPRISVTQLQPPPPASRIDIVVELQQGGKIRTRVRRRMQLDLASTSSAATPSAVGSKPQPSSTRDSHGSNDERLRLGGTLDVDGAPLGAGKSIEPPRTMFSPARLKPSPAKASETPSSRPVGGTITGVAVGGGGRYLILTLKQGDGGAVAIFDVNLATVLKRIPLTSPDALVAAGATTLLIAMPEQNRLQCWDLKTLQPKGESRPSPIQGRLKALAMGSDSEGPAIAFWAVGPKPYGLRPTWLSLIDLKSLDVLTVASIESSGSGHLKGHESLSPSHGAFVVIQSIGEGAYLHMRASPGGALFGMWDSSSWPSGFHTLSMSGSSLFAINIEGPFAHVAPGPDGRTIYTGLGGRLDPAGTVIGPAEPSPRDAPEIAIPTVEPLYSLTIAGLAGSLPGQPRPKEKPDAVTASIHATGDGTRLFTVYGLDEMAGLDRNDLFIPNDLTIDQRFHLVPAAKLLITIPPENDRVVLRRLDVDEALEQVGGDYLAVAALRSWTVTPGQTIEQAIVARSKSGGLTCTVADAPKGLSVTPDGKITWAVPKDFGRKGEDLKAVISVGDRSGKELFLTLKIRVK